MTEILLEKVYFNSLNDAPRILERVGEYNLTFRAVIRSIFISMSVSDVESLVLHQVLLRSSGGTI